MPRSLASSHNSDVPAALSIHRGRRGASVPYLHNLTARISSLKLAKDHLLNIEFSRFTQTPAAARHNPGLTVFRDLRWGRMGCAIEKAARICIVTKFSDRDQRPVFRGALTNLPTTASYGSAVANVVRALLAG